MDRKVKRNRQRIAICAFLAVISLLLLGAGRVTRELRERNHHKRAEIEQWREITLGVAESIPIEHQREWRELAENDPQAMLEICSID